MKCKYLILVLICVGDFPNGIHAVAVELFPSNDDNIRNYPIDHYEDDNFANTNIRSEALIKKIHPFIFPKQFNALDATATNAFNISTERNTSEINISENADRTDDNFELIPPLYDLSKHNTLHGYIDRPHYHHHQQQNNLLPINQSNNCLFGLLRPGDPLILLGILAFLAYVINSVLSLVDRINLPLLNSSTSSNLSSSSSNALSASNKGFITPRQYVDERFLDNNQNLLRDFERILHLAVETYDRKLNGI